MVSEKPLCVHVVGLEGSGHHGLEPLIKSMLFKAGDYKLVSRSPIQNILKDFFAKRKYSKQIFEEKISEFFEENTEKIIFFDCSYPWAKFRTVDDQYDIIYLNELFFKYCEMKFIHLQRNIFNCIDSRRNLDGGLIQHARVIGPINKYMCNQLSILKSTRGNVFDISYENIDLELLIKIFNIDPSKMEVVRSCYESVFKISKRDFLKKASLDEINEILEILK